MLLFCSFYSILFKFLTPDLPKNGLPLIDILLVHIYINFNSNSDWLKNFSRWNSGLFVRDELNFNSSSIDWLKFTASSLGQFVKL